MNALRESLMAVIKSKRVWQLQFLLNPALLGLGALWLLIPEAHTWQIAATTLLALVVVLLFLWLQSATLAYFEEFHSNGSARFRDNCRFATLPAFAMWAAVFTFLLHFVDHLSEFAPQLASYARSISPVWLRHLISEPRMDSLVALKFWVFFWIIVPGLLLPLGVQTAKHGFRGFGKEGRSGWRRSLGSRVYWSVLIVLAIAGAYLPQRLIEWLPEASSVNGETASLVLRFLLAWLLAVSAWTLLASVLGRVGSSEASSNVGRETTR